MMPPKVRSKNIPLMLLYSNVDKCETIATDTHMFMFLFIGSFLRPDFGSTVSLRYLCSLRNISQIKNYDWVGMVYATLLHIMAQLSWRSLSSLGGAPFVWQVWFKFFVKCIL